MKRLYATHLFLVIFVCITLISCRKGIPGYDPGEDGPETTPEVENATYYFKGTINNSKINWQVTESGKFYVGTGSISSLDKGVFTGALLASISGGTYPLIKPQIVLDIRTMKVSYDDDKFAYLKGFMTPGTWNYSLTDEFNFNVGTKAVLISYTDPAGKEYSTIGPQTGSSFNLVKVTVLPFELGRKDCLNISFKLNCKFYPKDGNGSVLSLTDAESTLQLENDL